MTVMFANTRSGRVAQASRLLAPASRRRGLSCGSNFQKAARNLESTSREVRFGETPKPTGGTPVLPGRNE